MIDNIVHTITHTHIKFIILWNPIPVAEILGDILIIIFAIEVVEHPSHQSVQCIQHNKEHPPPDDQKEHLIKQVDTQHTL